MANRHALLSIQRIVMEVAEPHRSALIKKADEKGIMYKLRCINPKGLRSRWDGVNRNFGPNEEKILPALVAAALIQTYNVDMVAGSATHPGGQTDDTPAPFKEPNFEEMVDENRTDLGPDLSLVQSGATSQSELLKEERETGYEPRRGMRTGSDEPGNEEIRSVMPGAKPAKPMSSTEV